MTERIFLACIEEENGKNYAFVEVIRVGENIKPILERHGKCDVFHLCKSRKQADEIVTDWNAKFRANGNYMFAEE